MYRVKEGMLKVQVVKSYPITRSTDPKSDTIGKQIDLIIAECQQNGELPNKIVVDFSLPPEPDPESMS